MPQRPLPLVCGPSQVALPGSIDALRRTFAEFARYASASAPGDPLWIDAATIP